MGPWWAGGVQSERGEWGGVAEEDEGEAAKVKPTRVCVSTSKCIH